MLFINSKPRCDEAKLFYYDYLYNRKDEIPFNIIKHIEVCTFCKDEIEKLNRTLIDNANESKGMRSKGYQVTRSLKLQLALANKKATCCNVKPFLPSLADPYLQTKIPTPVTVHIEHCDQCLKDLEAIRNLQLNHKQLCILSQMISEPRGQQKLCSQAQEAVPHVVSLSLNKVSPDILKHLCTCPDCRLKLYQRRELVIKGLMQTNTKMECARYLSLQPTDIFDYCFPYGLNSKNDQYAKFRKALTSHISTCVFCLGKMQKLHNSISDLMERTDSGIVTCYKIDPNEIDAISDEESTYEGWPVKVEVYDSSKEQKKAVPVQAETKARKRNFVISFTKVMSAAAAIILLLSFYLAAPSAKAVSLNRIYTTLSKIKNVYFATYVHDPDEDTLLEERWISASLSTILTKVNSQASLFNIGQRRHEIIEDTQAGSPEQQPSESIDWGGMKTRLQAPWGLLPFNDVSDAPDNSETKWEKIDSTAVDFTQVENCEIYELSWKEQTTTGISMFNKWRGYVDIDTQLPKRIELWQKIAPAQQYELRAIKKIEYPSDTEIAQKIEDTGFNAIQTR